MVSSHAEGTLILTRSEIERLLPLADYIPVIERAFALHAEGRSLASGLMPVDCDDGEFHIKGGGLRLPRRRGGQGQRRLLQEHGAVRASGDTALQEVAAALAVHEKAIERGAGLTIDMKK